MGIQRVEFYTTKYGPEMLVDAAWVREMPTFLLPGPHALTFYDILFVTSGRGWFWLDTYRHPVTPAQVFFTTPGQVRRWEVEDLDGLCLFFPAAFLEEFFNDSLFLHRLPYFHVPEARGALSLGQPAANALRRHLLAMRRELRVLRPDSVHLLRARLYEILITLSRQYSSQRGGASQLVPHGMALRFRELVERDASRHHGVAWYARELGVTPGHLNVLTRRHLGRGAKEVIAERLALQARRMLLYSEKSAAQVGFGLGFQDPSYFTRFFRRETGRSPSAFRREAGGTA
ncbi:MAG TPA: helix-turn-helix transcriptional regulator [Gemmatimonadales bacterium]|jgi:AraC-like DNA-binding protein